jgi:hypothetical protein
MYRESLPERGRWSLVRIAPRIGDFSRHIRHMQTSTGPTNLERFGILGRFVQEARMSMNRNVPGWESSLKKILANIRLTPRPTPHTVGALLYEQLVSTYHEIASNCRQASRPVMGRIVNNE